MPFSDQNHWKSNTITRSVWKTKKVKIKLGANICASILFIHALLNCDITSHIHGVGKGEVLKMFASNSYIIFGNDNSTPKEIQITGGNALVCLYGGKSGEKLDVLRYQKYCEKVVRRNTRIQPQSLPQTSSTVRFHSLCVRLQVVQWNNGRVAVQRCHLRNEDGLSKVITWYPLWQTSPPCTSLLAASCEM